MKQLTMIFIAMALAGCSHYQTSIESSADLSDYRMAYIEGMLDDSASLRASVVKELNDLGYYVHSGRVGNEATPGDIIARVDYTTGFDGRTVEGFQVDLIDAVNGVVVASGSYRKGMIGSSSFVGRVFKKLRRQILEAQEVASSS